MRLLQWMRKFPGILLKDLPLFYAATRYSGPGFQSDPHGWISLCNRIESLKQNTEGQGVQCLWKWGSDLVACNAIPALGRKLMQAALAEWPVCFSDRPPVDTPSPDISFIFAHAGRDRLAQLCRTIRSVYAQTDCSFEVIVVDQSDEPVISALPDGVRFRHLSKRDVPAGWYKSWAYNVGARMARSEVLVFQDGDICMPHRYAREVHRTLSSGEYDAASLQRLLFYLDRSSTERVETRDAFDVPLVPERVFQNWKGGTIAIRREAFFHVGGFDEGFVDWGGEDDEFFDRCSAIRHCRYGYLPFVHLWHSPQSGRKQSDNPNISTVMPWRMEIPVASRVVELNGRSFGDDHRPDPEYGYKNQLDQIRKVWMPLKKLPHG